MSDNVFAGLDDVVEQLDTAVTETDRQKDGIDARIDQRVKSAEQTHRMMLAETGAGLSEDFADGLREAGEIEKALLDRTLAEQLAELREAGETAFRDAEVAIETAYHDAIKAQGPQTADQWTRAAAQREFVRDELAALDSEAIGERVRVALTGGDPVDGYLYSLEAFAILDKRAEGMDASTGMQTREASQASRVLRELRQTRFGAIEQQRVENLNRLRAYRSQVNRRRVPATQQEVREFAARFNLDPRFVDPMTLP